jgi:hypothetical protein
MAKSKAGEETRLLAGEPTGEIIKTQRAAFFRHHRRFGGGAA